MKKYLPFAIECIFLFYLMPLIISFIPIISGINEMTSLVINIFLLTIFALFCGRKHRFSLLIPLIAALLFIPAGFILSYSPMRVSVFAGIYAVVALIGELLGLMFKKK
ncbi:MAG: hypothetical protein IJX99_09090 [Clostridia bacterium]|nr:hypothetical protein [Clostridia bacterium]